MTFAADGPSFDLMPQPKPVWGSVASIGVHGALLALMLIAARAVPVEPPEAPEAPSIAVDLISATQFASLLATTTPPPTALPDVTSVPEPAVIPDAAVPEPTTPAPDAKPPVRRGTIRATTFYSGDLLAEPESAKLAAALRQTESRERMVQICDIEAMEQVRRAMPEFDPDIVVAYAFADTELRNGSLVAEGAAFRSGREWYEMKFTCGALPDLSGVRAFEFSVGDIIPHEDWDAHYLTAEESDD